MPQFGNLFTYETISKSDSEFNWTFNKCTLLKDFSDFKKGDTVDSIATQLSVFGWDEENNLVMDDTALVNEDNFPENPFIQ